MILDSKPHIKIEQRISELRHYVFLGSLRWLHATDFDSSSKSFGIGDREYWSWKTKDFANATWQGGLAGFLDVHEHLKLSKESINTIVRANIFGTKALQRYNGSFEEAYPWESSVCVTALVLFNLLYAYMIYPQYFDPQATNVLKIIANRSFKFLEKTPETHGVIANHEATNVFAKRMARRFLGLFEDNVDLNNFLKLQDSKENWYPEYEGPDPGYQTLLNHYVIGGAYALGELQLITTSLESSLDFVSLFCFPDGTFGGEVGARGTSIVYPSGFLSLGEENSLKQSRATQWFLTQHQNNMDAVTPLTVDASNFVPVFNSWAFFSKIASTTPHFFNNSLDKDFIQEEVFLEKGGIVVKKTKRAYLAISLHNATVRKSTLTDKMIWTDGSLAALTFQEWTTQGVAVENFERNGCLLSWRYQAIKRKQIFSNSGKLMILRMLSLLFFPFPQLQRALKKALVAYIMKSSVIRSTSIRAQINLSDPDLTLNIINNSNEHWESHSFGFHRHMASANTFSKRALP